MPSAYTAKLYEQEISFKEFALICTRAFLIAMRDEPFNAPLPDEFKKDEDYLNDIKNLQNELKEIENINEQEAEKKALEEYDFKKHCYESELEKTLIILKRFKNMEIKVANWIPSIEYENLKNFMLEQLKCTIEQLENTIKNDKIYQPIKISGKRWKKEKILSIKNDINNAKKDYCEEIKQINAMNQWVKKLKQCL